MGKRIDVYRWSVYRKNGQNIVRGIRRGIHTTFIAEVYAFFPARPTMRGCVRYEAVTNIGRKVYLLGEAISLKYYDDSEKV